MCYQEGAFHDSTIVKSCFMEKRSNLRKVRKKLKIQFVAIPLIIYRIYTSELVNMSNNILPSQVKAEILCENSMITPTLSLDNVESLFQQQSQQQQGYIQLSIFGPQSTGKTTLLRKITKLLGNCNIGGEIGKNRSTRGILLYFVNCDSLISPIMILDTQGIFSREETSDVSKYLRDNNVPQYKKMAKNAVKIMSRKIALLASLNSQIICVMLKEDDLQRNSIVEVMRHVQDQEDFGGNLKPHLMFVIRSNDEDWCKDTMREILDDPDNGCSRIQNSEIFIVPDCRCPFFDSDCQNDQCVCIDDWKEYDNTMGKIVDYIESLNLQPIATSIIKNKFEEDIRSINNNTNLKTRSEVYTEYCKKIVDEYLKSLFSDLISIDNCNPVKPITLPEGCLIKFREHVRDRAHFIDTSIQIHVVTEGIKSIKYFLLEKNIEAGQRLSDCIVKSVKKEIAKSRENIIPPSVNYEPWLTFEKVMGKLMGPTKCESFDLNKEYKRVTETCILLIDKYLIECTKTHIERHMSDLQKEIGKEENKYKYVSCKKMIETFEETFSEYLQEPNKNDQNNQINKLFEDAKLEMYRIVFQNRADVKEKVEEYCNKIYNDMYQKLKMQSEEKVNELGRGMTDEEFSTIISELESEENELMSICQESCILQPIWKNKGKTFVFPKFVICCEKCESDTHQCSKYGPHDKRKECDFHGNHGGTDNKPEFEVKCDKCGSIRKFPCNMLDAKTKNELPECSEPIEWPCHHDCGNNIILKCNDKNKPQKGSMCYSGYCNGYRTNLCINPICNNLVKDICKDKPDKNGRSIRTYCGCTIQAQCGNIFRPYNVKCEHIVDKKCDKSIKQTLGWIRFNDPKGSRGISLPCGEYVTNSKGENGHYTPCGGENTRVCKICNRTRTWKCGESGHVCCHQPINPKLCEVCGHTTRLIIDQFCGHPDKSFEVTCHLKCPGRHGSSEQDIRKKAWGRRCMGTHCGAIIGRDWNYCKDCVRKVQYSGVIPSQWKKFHSSEYNGYTWNCCGKTGKSAEGCKELHQYSRFGPSNH